MFANSVGGLLYERSVVSSFLRSSLTILFGIFVFLIASDGCLKRFG